MKPTTREWVKKAENDFKVASLILRRRKDMVLFLSAVHLGYKHAAPKGAWPSIRGGRYYKHGAPNGAGNIFVAQDTYKEQGPGSPPQR